MNILSRIGVAVSLLFYLLPSVARGTAQYPENILIDGNPESMMATPLEDYWNSSRPKPDSLAGSSSALWRGYIGSWEIKNDELILLKMEQYRYVGKDGTHQRQSIPISKKAVLGVKTEAPLMADWFSGVLRIARGKQLAYVHMGFGSVYEEDLFLFVDRGKIIRRLVVKNDPANLTSPSDLSWRELGNMTESGGVKVKLPEEIAAAEKGAWLTLTEIFASYGDLISSNKKIRVRGIFFPERLWFPPQGGMDATFKLDTGKLKNLPASGSAAELMGLLQENDGEFTIVVSEIRQLPPGTPIQRPLPPGK